MKALLQQSFFRLLSEYSQRKVSASELTKAVEELAIHVANFSINEQDYSVLLRYFSFGYIVLSHTVYGLSKKKMPYLHLIDEAIGLLNTEIRLIEWRIKYPEQLQQRINKQPLSPLYSRRQDNPYQHHGNGKRSVPLQKHRVSERQARLLGGLGESL